VPCEHLRPAITDPIFHNEAKAAFAHIEATAAGPMVSRVTCPHCGSDRIRRMEGKTQAGMFLCNDCRDKFTVRTGTVMERSHVPLHKWLLATHLMAASKKGMSAKQMERMLGVTYKTAWFLCHRIREAMDGAPATTVRLAAPTRLSKPMKPSSAASKRTAPPASRAPKKPVVALVERDGHVRSFHVANVNAKHVRGLIVTNVDRARTS
jgi:transposase-like protein